MARGAFTGGGWFGIGLEPRGAEMELVSSTSSDDVQHGSMQNVRASESHGFGKIMSDGLFAIIKDLDIYKEAKTSLEMR